MAPISTTTTTTGTDSAASTSILTVASSNAMLDAKYLQSRLLLTSIVSSSHSSSDGDDDDDDDDTVVIETTGTKNGDHDDNSGTTTSLWISPLNTVILFWSPPNDDAAPPSSVSHPSTAGKTNVTVWSVPAAFLQELRSIPPSTQTTTTFPQTPTIPDPHPFPACTAVIQTLENDNSTGDTPELVIRLPSGRSCIVVIPNSLPLSTRRIRQSIIQRMQWLGQQPNSIEMPGDPEQLPNNKNYTNRMVDIPLLTSSDHHQQQQSSSDATANRTAPQTCVGPENEATPPQPMVFTSLESKILTIDASLSTSSSLLPDDTKRHLSYQPLTLNSSRPIPFETDLFRGQILMILRPEPATEDPFWYERIFRTKKRRCIINVQGQFKSVPQGIVYAGAEVSQPMRLGMVMKGICTILLKLVERFNSNIHSSFGTTNANEENPEAAHIVAPAYTFYERLVVTSPNEPPPSILDEIMESPESIQSRKSCTSLTAQPKIWNTTDTFTFSFYSMYIDLPSWQLVGLPASGDIGLQTFWGSSLLRICMYDKTDPQKQHVLSKNRYAFSVQLEYLGKNGDKRKQQQQQSQHTMESPKITRKMSEDYVINENSDRGKKDIFHTDRILRHNLIQQQQQQSYQVMRHSESQLFFHESSSCDESINENDEDDDDDVPFFDAKESYTSLQDEGSGSPSLLLTGPVPAIDDKLIQQLSITDQYCPYWVELCVPSRNGNSLQYVTAFLCRMKCDSIVWTTFRLESECHNLLDETVDNSSSMPFSDVIGATMNRFSSRMSSLEKMRRCVGLILSEEYGDAASMSSNMIAFRKETERQSFYDLQFLSPSKIKPSTSNMVGWSGFIARAYSDRHWVEEWVCVYEGHITFRHMDRRKSSEFVLLLSNIRSVEKLDPDLGPCNTTNPILAVSTLASTVYLMFASDSDLGRWRQMIDPSLLQQQMNKLSTDGVNNNIVDSIGTAADDLLHKSSIWNCKNRRILNCGSCFFRTIVPTIDSFNPLTMAEHALRQATEIATNGLDNCTEQQLYDFMRCAAALKQTHVSGLDEASRLAFFLNVYHTMISHAYLVLGPPDSSLKWINYFNNIAYQVGDDIFSLTELEHSVIRASMSYPTQFLSRFVIPKSAYPSLALTISDCRINFALNCGSRSNPSKILLYQPQRLSQQLDEASRLYFLNSVTHRRTGSGDLELKLPRICQWFADDFGHGRPDLLSAIEPYLSLEVQRQLDGCRLATPEGKQHTGMKRFDMSCIIIRYHSYNFECRPLSLL